MNTTFTFRTDENIKSQASEIYKELGLDLSTALNMFLRLTVKKRRMPISVDFDVDIDPIKTYPNYFWKLAGKGKDLVFEDPDDPLPDDRDFNL